MISAAGPASWRDVALETRGFMPVDEGDGLYDAALRATLAVPGSPIVEIGSYCGRSTVWLAAAARAGATVVLTVDHHRGSEENQAGWEHHDPALVDPMTGRMDTLATFRRTVEAAGLEEVVIAVVGDSSTFARWWTAPCAMVFVDGGHGAAVARADYESWAGHVAVGGSLAIHDVFEDETFGGLAPYEEIYRPAVESGLFVVESCIGSLRTLRRCA